MMSEWGGDDRGPVTHAVVWSLTALSLLAVALRLLSRTAFDGNKLGLDDLLTTISVMIIMASSVAISLSVVSGIGRHVATLTPLELMESSKRTVIANFFVVWSFSMPKFALIALLRRLLRLSKWTEIGFWGVGIANQLGILVLSLYWFVRCRPVAKGWNPSLPGSCDPVQTLGDLGYVFSAISAALDLFFALYPIPFVMRLQMRLQKRVYISMSLGLGSIASVVSIYKLSTFPAVLAGFATDPTYEIVPLVLFANVEANILILAASLPTLGPLIRWVSRETSTGPGRSDATKQRHRRSETWASNRPIRVAAPSSLGEQQNMDTDSVPLVRNPKHQRGGDQPGASSQIADPPQGVIQKSVHISVSYDSR